MGHPTGSESDDEEKISCWKKVKRRVPVFSAIFLMLFCSSLYFVFMLVLDRTLFIKKDAKCWICFCFSATHFFIQTEIYWKVLVIVQGFIAVFMFVNFLCATFSDPGFFQKCKKMLTARNIQLCSVICLNSKTLKMICSLNVTYDTGLF